MVWVGASDDQDECRCCHITRADTTPLTGTISECLASCGDSDAYPRMSRCRHDRPMPSTAAGLPPYSINTLRVSGREERGGLRGDMEWAKRADTRCWVHARWRGVDERHFEISSFDSRFDERRGEPGHTANKVAVRLWFTSIDQSTYHRTYFLVLRFGSG